MLSTFLNPEDICLFLLVGKPCQHSSKENPSSQNRTQCYDTACIYVGWYSENRSGTEHAENRNEWNAFAFCFLVKVLCSILPVSSAAYTLLYVPVM